MIKYSLKRYFNKIDKIDTYHRDYRLSKLPPYLHQVIIGLLLSDGGLERPSDNGGARLSVIISHKNYPYILHLYNIFEPYIDTDINILDVKVKVKIYSTVRFKTITTPFLLHYYSIFYLQENDKMIRKVVPTSINENFTPVMLAHLIIGDGNFLESRNIIRIYTNSFEEKDVKLLSDALNKLGLNSYIIHDRNNQFIIIIEKKDLEKVQELVMPFMHPSIIYRIGVKSNNDKFQYESILKNI